MRAQQHQKVSMSIYERESASKSDSIPKKEIKLFFEIISIRTLHVILLPLDNMKRFSVFPLSLIIDFLSTLIVRFIVSTVTGQSRNAASIKTCRQKDLSKEKLHASRDVISLTYDNEESLGRASIVVQRLCVLGDSFNDRQIRARRGASDR